MSAPKKEEMKKEDLREVGGSSLIFLGILVVDKKKGLTFCFVRSIIYFTVDVVEMSIYYAEMVEWSITAVLKENPFHR